MMGPNQDRSHRSGQGATRLSQRRNAAKTINANDNDGMNQVRLAA